MEHIELSFASLQYNSPIIQITFKDKTEIGYFEVRELISSCEKLSGGYPYYVLSDARSRVNVTPQGRRLSMDRKAAPLHKATAVLIESKMMKTAVNFFGKISRPRYPYKVFTNKQDAIGWLREVHAHHAINEQYYHRVQRRA